MEADASASCIDFVRAAFARAPNARHAAFRRETILNFFSWILSDRLGAGAVAKELIARDALERIAMQEIRAFPDCEHVTNVEIEYRLDKVLKTNWTMHVFTREGANLARIQQAINATRHRLQHRYDLRSEA
jgi:hypothetical protein